jgi:undecaprenyl-diphosphatase
MITYFQAIVIGLLQGVTELFPISSLGHSVVVPWLLGWDSVLKSQSSGESFFLPFLVALHVACGIALFIFYRKTWFRIIGGLFGSVKKRKIDTPDAKLGWLLIAATIPAGITGLAFEHQLRTQFAKPLSAIIFLGVNGLILLAGEHFSKQGKQKAHTTAETAAQVSGSLTFKRAMIIGVSQIAALFAGISRSGITMLGGLLSGLNGQDAARFSFLLATPIIFGAGLLKLPDFFSNLDAGVRGQIIAGGLVAGAAAYLSVKYLDKYFQNKSLKPFGVYCLSMSALLLVVGLFRGGF